jgi:signal transduction histidine kinase
LGVPKHERAHIFERFYRVAGTGQSGSGIGLSLVKRIAQLHDAEIEVSDGLDGRGICVAVRFKSPTEGDVRETAQRIP